MRLNFQASIHSEMLYQILGISGGAGLTLSISWYLFVLKCVEWMMSMTIG